MKTFIQILLCIVLASSAGSVLAQGGHAPDGTVAEANQIEKTPQLSGGFFSGLENAGALVKNRLSKMQTGQLMSLAQGYASKLTGAALALGGSLALCYLLFESIRHMAGGRTNYIQVLVDVGIPAVVAAALIKGYPGHVESFSSFLDIVRTVVGEPGGLAGSIIDMYSKVLCTLGATILKTFQNVNDATWGIVTGIMTAGQAGSGIGYLLLVLVDLVLSVCYCLAILALVVLGLSNIVSMVLMGPFLFAVGVAFGPIFLACLVTPWTRDYVGRWVGFLVSAALLTGVLGVIIGLTGAVFSMFDTSSALAAGESSSAASLIVLAIFLMTVNALLSQAGSIASALSPGSAGVSGGSSGGGVMSLARQLNPISKLKGK